MAHSPEAKRASASSLRPEYVKYPALFQEDSIEIQRTINRVLKVRRASLAPAAEAMPFPCVAKRWLCHALMFSTSTQDCHAVVRPQLCPDSTSTPSVFAASYQVFGGSSGSSCACRKASRLK